MLLCEEYTDVRGCALKGCAGRALMGTYREELGARTIPRLAEFENVAEWCV